MRSLRVSHPYKEKRYQAEGKVPPSLGSGGPSQRCRWGETTTWWWTARSQTLTPYILSSFPSFPSLKMKFRAGAFGFAMRVSYCAGAETDSRQTLNPSFSILLASRWASFCGLRWS